MQDPYEEYFRRARRRDRAEVAMLVGAILMMVAVISVVVLAWQLSAENQRIATTFEAPPTPR